MRRLLLAIPASLLLLASNAGAQSTHYPLVDSESTSTLQANAPRAVHVDDLAIREVCGTYVLSNGWRLHVRPAWNGVVATIDEQKPMRLLALSPDKYVTRDGNVAMEFNRGEDRDEMLMSYVPDPRLAEVIVVRSTMASR
jgi:nitrogen fixation protein